MNLGTDGFFFHCTVTCLAKCQVRCIAVPLGDEKSNTIFFPKILYIMNYFCVQSIFKQNRYSKCKIN